MTCLDHVRDVPVFDSCFASFVDRMNASVVWQDRSKIQRPYNIRQHVRDESSQPSQIELQHHPSAYAIEAFVTEFGGTLDLLRRTLRISGPARDALISKPTRPPAPLHAIVLARFSLAFQPPVNYGTFDLDFESSVQQRRAIRTEKLTIVWAKILQKSASF